MSFSLNSQSIFNFLTYFVNEAFYSRDDFAGSSAGVSELDTDTTALYDPLSQETSLKVDNPRLERLIQRIIRAGLPLDKKLYITNWAWTFFKTQETNRIGKSDNGPIYDNQAEKDFEMQVYELIHALEITENYEMNAKDLYGHRVKVTKTVKDLLKKEAQTQKIQSRIKEAVGISKL